MWIVTENGELRNMDYAYKVVLFEHYNKFYVQATFSVATGKNSVDPAFAEVATLKVFDNKEDATTCIEMLVDCLNGKKPVEYAFTWLKNLKAPKPAEPAKTKTYDADLVDGVPF